MDFRAGFIPGGGRIYSQFMAVVPNEHYERLRELLFYSGICSLKDQQ